MKLVFLSEVLISKCICTVNKFITQLIGYKLTPIKEFYIMKEE
jgi:hypothetical protein